MTIAADGRAFVAAVWKELRQLRRYPTWFLGSLFWPILLPATYVLQGRAFSGGDARAIEAFRGVAGTTDVAGFVFVGWALYMWLSIVLWGPGTSLRNEQIRGTLEALFVTPASRLVILFGPPAAYLALAGFQFVVMVTAMRVLFGVELTLPAVARALVVILLTVPAMYGIGALFATLTLRSGEIGSVVQFVRGFFSLFCGITYPIVVLPDWARAIAQVLPPTYFVADARAVLLAGAALGDLMADLGALVALGLVVCAGAAAAFAFVERAARRSGSLARY
ncbi:MAG TPA: ABC transporter permease [Candidatus Limnocylindria bacterium]|nr:ABC transporter permease [Candidatus Limnocylindria bacterium]